MPASKTQRCMAIVLGAVLLVLASCGSDPQKAKIKYYASGQKYMKQKKYGEAAIEFRNAIRIDPNFTDAYYQLGQAALAQHNWQIAYASLEKVIDLDPGRLDARLDRARIYLAARQFDKVEEDANLIIKEDPGNVGAYQLLGAAFVGQQKPTEALAAFSKLIELVPDDAGPYLSLALVDVSLHRFQDAEEYLKKAVATDPKSIRATVDLANVYRLENRLPEAQEVLQAGIQRNPDAPELYIARASILSNTGTAAEAEEVLNKLRNQMPKSSDAAIAIGDYYQRTNNSERALSEYRRGLSESPDNLEIEKRLQDMYISTGQINAAIPLDKQLMSHALLDPLIGVLHGRLLLAQGKQQDAIIALQNAVKNAPNVAMAHYYLALAYWQNEKLGEASSELQEALKEVPGLPLILQSLVQLSVLQNHISQAQSFAAEWVQSNPADVNARVQLGSIYLAQGQFQLAEEQLFAAKRLAPNQASVHLNVAILNGKEGKWKESKQEFETAMRLDPSDAKTISAYADFLVSRKERENAVMLVRRFLEANPQSGQAHVLLGTLLFDPKNLSAAQTQFEQAIQADAKNLLAYVKLAETYRAQNQMEAALVQYNKALELEPKSAPLITLVGNAYLEKDDLETARKYFLRALDVDPNFPAANANLAWVDAENGQNLDVALAMAQKATSLIPEQSSATDVLGWVLYKRGDYSGAIPLFELCVKKTPDSAQFRYHLGLALLAAGQREAARVQLLAALHANNLRAADQEQAKQALMRFN